MRIAFYSPFARVSSPSPSGDRTQARALIAALRALGHDVEVISDYHARSFWLRSRRLKQLPSSLWAAHSRVRAFRPDAWLTFVSQWDAPDVLGPIVTAERDIPYVIYKAPFKNGTIYADLRRNQGALRHVWAGLPGWSLHTLALRRADSVVVNKLVDFEAYQQVPSVRGKLSLLWPAVPLGQFRPDVAGRARVRRELGVDDDTALLLSVGRLSDAKGRKAESLRFLIDAVADLLERGRQTKVVIAGEGDTRAELEAYAAKLGAAARFVGQVDYDDLPAWYGAADLFVYPGLREHIGLVYLEAQACGVPVVAFANGGIPAVVKDGETGFLVPPMDQQAFVDRLDRLVGDAELRRRLGANARLHVEQHHDSEAWAKTLADLLSEGAQRPARGQAGSEGSPTRRATLSNSSRGSNGLVT